MSKFVALATILCCAVSAVRASGAHLGSCAATLASSNVKPADASACFDKIVNDRSTWSRSLDGYFGDAAWNLLAALRDENSVEKFATGETDNLAWVRENIGNVQGLDTDACGDFKTGNDAYYEYLEKAIAGSKGERTLVNAVKAGEDVAACIVFQKACDVLRS